MNRTAEAVFSRAISQFTQYLRRSGEAALAVVALSAAQAQAQPLPWEIGLQPAATPVMANIHAFHDAMLVLSA